MREKRYSPTARGVCRRPASDEVDGAGVLDLVGQALRFRPGFGGESAQYGRLLADLLGHVVGIAFQAFGFFFPGDVPDAGVCFLPTAGDVVHGNGVSTDQRCLTVFEEREPPRVLEQGRGIAGQVVAVLTPAKHQR
jgi:hypothetical protein